MIAMVAAEQSLPTTVSDPSPVFRHQPEELELRKEGARLASGPMQLSLLEFLKPGERYVPGNVMLERSENQVGELGSLASQYHAEALEAMPADQTLAEWRAFTLVFPDTEWWDSDGRRRIVYLDWSGDGWELGFEFLVSVWGAGNRVVRVSQVSQ